MVKKSYLLGISSLILVLLSSLALADGGFFPPVYYKEDIYEPTQKGMIIFDGKTEQLIIEATYEGEMNDFAWIIPVPSYPDINKSSTYLFEELHFLTEPKYKKAPGFSFLGRRTFAKVSETVGVTVHEQKQVGIYEVSVLSSEDSGALLKWLNDNNYRVSSEAESILDFYIQKKWYFMAMRINLVPHDEKLISSLQNINPSISSTEDAISILTDDIVNYIESETIYNELTAIRTTEIDYGEDEEELFGDYRSREIANRPSVLITENDYNKFYEQYNGYFEDHILNKIENEVQSVLNNEIIIPDSWQCYNSVGQNIYFSRCYVWYFTKDSEEYQLLKDVECGKYCSLISEEKEQYTMDDLAKVGAYAVIKGDDRVKNYFGVIKEKYDWYDNEQDRLSNVENQIRNILRGTLNIKRTSLVNQLTNELTTEYSQKTDSTFGSINEISTFFSEKTLDDFKQNKAFSSSYIYGFGLLTNQEYNEFKSLFDGDHNELKLKNNIETIVKNVIYWKQTTVQRKLGSGTVQPISIKFSTIDIIYPLKISSINKGASEVLLYVFAKYRTKVEGIEGFETEYAKWIETDDIKTDSYYSYLSRIREQAKTKPIYYYWVPSTYYYLNQLLDDRYFLTKFRKEMWPKEMTDDLLITQDKNNKEYRLTVYQDGYVLGWIGFFISLFIAWGILFGISFLPRWINNKMFSEESVFYASIKRCAVYALVIPIIMIFSGFFSNTVGRLAGNIVDDFFGEIFEFIFHLFNYIGLPGFINGIIVFIFGVIFIFFVIHIIISGIIQLYRRIRPEQVQYEQ